MLPAAFMTAVCTTYILIAPEGFQLATAIAYPVGIVITTGTLLWFFRKKQKKQR